MSTTKNYYDRIKLNRDDVNNYKWLVKNGSAFSRLEQEDRDFVNKTYTYENWKTLATEAHWVLVGFLAQFNDDWEDDIINCPLKWAEQSHGIYEKANRLGCPVAHYLVNMGSVSLIYDWYYRGDIPADAAAKIDFQNPIKV